MANKVWGIDLGTTYSCIARMDEFERSEVVRNRDGDVTTPSVVLFGGPDDHHVGKEAKRQLQLDPDSAVEHVKREMGDPEWRFEAQGKEWSAPQVSAIILKALAADAEKLADEPVEDVVITVPAYFGDVQREATRAAGKIAGLKVVDLINEPTAAAFSYGFAQDGVQNETVLVYDLGGGTFDVTVIRLEDDSISVIVTDGDYRLGGADWDQRLAEELARRFTQEHPDAPNPLDDDIGKADLSIKAEDFKRALTDREKTGEMVQAGAERARIEFTRDEFETLTEDLLQRTIDLTRNAIEEAKQKGVEGVDRVLLVGGSSFMPAVSRRLNEEFGFVPELENPNLAVAMGAALYGQREQLRQLLKERLEGMDIDPDETTAEAEAARDAVIAEIAPDFGLSREVAKKLVDTEVTNVCSRGFGVKLQKDDVDAAAPGFDPDDTNNYLVKHYVERNDPLPKSVVDTLTTTVPNQPTVHLVVLEQGGSDLSERIEDNNLVVDGHIDLPGDDPARSPLELTFVMENDGTLRVELRHPRVEQRLILQKDTGAALSEAEIEQARSEVDALVAGG